MAEIKCPNCGTIISLEQSELDSVVRQVRDEQFERDLAERVALVEENKAREVELAEQRVRSEFQKEVGGKNARIAELEAQLKASAGDVQTQLRAQAAELKASSQADLAQLQLDKDAQITQLKAQIDGLRESQAAHEQLAVTQAVATVEKERDGLAAQLKIKESERETLEAHMKEQLVEQARTRDEIIALKDQEIERLRDMKARLSNKMLGESLEMHCLNEFNRVRAMAFPNAYFEKDNEAVEGTKGDFIFRECDEEGTEIISIMFEMKNEYDESAVRKKNEEHFAKLDRDRTKKGGEYAVLVSLLEPDSELYNDGIVDVSYRYPKMFVVRPQFFLAIISLLRQGALASLKYKQEIQLMRRQELDITHFEEDLETFKQGFFKNFGDASKRFEEAIEAIDKAIADLQKVKDKLVVSEKHLSAANNKLEGLTVKKLTRKNPTMKAKFEELEG